MKKNLILSIILSVYASVFAQITQKDFLKVSTGAANEIWNTGQYKSTWDIVNTTGERVYLRGVNAGGWLVHEPWMTPINGSGSVHDQMSVMNELTRRFGSVKRDELVKIYEDNYWTETDFNNCAAMGMSVIRLPFWYINLVYMGDGDGTRHALRSNAWERLDWFIENCAKRGMYVILDMHGAFGSQNGQDHSGEVNGGWELYTGANKDYNQEKTVWLWGEIAKRYAPIRQGDTRNRANDRPDLAAAVAMYDILNEPGPKAGVTNKTQWDVYHKIYQEIRKYDPEHIICMESCWGTRDLPKVSDHGYNWTNVVYQYHHYSWDNVSNEEGQKSFYTARVNEVRNANHGVPTYIGEFTAFNIRGAWDFALQTYNDAGWHYTVWTYKVKGNSSWGIYNHNPGDVNIQTDSEQQIRDKWGRVGTATSYAWANTMVRDALMAKMPGTVKTGGGNPYATANLALNKSISASSVENGNTNNYAANQANDGLASSRWASVHGAQSQWIKVDLGDDYSINGIRLLWEAAYAVKYKVEVSTDDNNWTTVKDETDGTGGANNIDANDVLARYVRVTMTERATINGSQYGYSLYEFEVYGKKATVINIPGTFNSLDYSKKSGEISDNNGSNGKFIGNLVNGSSVEYLINVSNAGQYALSIDAAASGTNSRTITVFSQGAALGTLSVVNGNDWFAFAPLKTNISLPAGQQTLKFVTTGAVNIRDITISTADNITVNVAIPENGIIYSGALVTPAVNVREGNAALSAANYDVSYENNTNAGTAKVKVVGKGNYSTLDYEQEFTIGKKELTIALKQEQYSIRLRENLPDFSNEIEIKDFADGDNISVIKKGGNAAFQTSDVAVSHGYNESEPLPGNYRLQISSESELSADNYNISFGEGVLTVIDPNASSIKSKIVKDNKQGIIINENPAKSENAEFEIRTLKPSFVSVTIYDNVGNSVFKGEDFKTDNENFVNVTWNLRNNAGRIVANGSYLVVAEVKERNTAKLTYYSEKFGVKLKK